MNPESLPGVEPVVVQTQVPAVCGKYSAIRLHAELWHRALADLADRGSLSAVAERGPQAPGRAILLYHYGSFDWAAWALCWSRSSVFVFHNVTPAGQLWRWSPLVALRAVAAQIQLHLMPKRLPWLAVSEFNRRQLLKIGFRSVETVPLIVEAQSPGEKSETALLLFVGRICPSKNVIALLRAFASAWERSRDKPRLVIVGSRKRRCRYGDAFERELESCPAREHVEWHAGALRYSELQRLYRSAWLYVSMSRHEGFGAPICEAISFGTPALFLECGGTETVVGRAGCVAQGGPGPFVSRTLELLADQTARQALLREQALAVGQLSRSRVSGRLLSVLEEKREVMKEGA